jgi:hypothetical protein
LSDDPEVVAVQVDRMVEADSAAVLDHVDCPFVG